MKKVSCNNGHEHQVVLQANLNDCGPTCLRMAYQRVKNVEPPSSLNFVYSIDLAPVGGIYTGTTCTGMRSMVKVAQSIGLKAEVKYHPEYADLRRELVKAGSGDCKAIIVHVQWAKGGAHSVMIDKCDSANDVLCVCDPGSEVVQRLPYDPFDPIGVFRYSCDYVNRGLTLKELAAGASRTVTNSGQFSGWICIISS